MCYVVYKKKSVSTLTKILASVLVCGPVIIAVVVMLIVLYKKGKIGPKKNRKQNYEERPLTQARLKEEEECEKKKEGSEY